MATASGAQTQGPSLREMGKNARMILESLAQNFNDWVHQNPQQKQGQGHGHGRGGSIGGGSGSGGTAERRNLIHLQLDGDNDDDNNNDEESSFFRNGPVEMGNMFYGGGSK